MPSPQCAPGSTGCHLAIELAAARIRTFSPLELLDHDERLVFERASVFPGEFAYDTAEAVLAFTPLDSDGFARAFPSLLDRSLLSRRRQPDQTTSYRMRETFRVFGQRELGQPAVGPRPSRDGTQSTTSIVRPHGCVTSRAATRWRHGAGSTSGGSTSEGLDRARRDGLPTDDTLREQIAAGIGAERFAIALEEGRSTTPWTVQ